MIVKKGPRLELQLRILNTMRSDLSKIGLS